MSQTPETDAAKFSMPVSYVATSDKVYDVVFAEKVERLEVSRNALRAELEEAKAELQRAWISNGDLREQSEILKDQLTEAKRERDEEKKRADFAWKNTQEIDLVRVKERAERDRALAASHSQYQELVKEKIDLEEELVKMEADLAQARELIAEMQKQDQELCSKFEAQADHLIKADSDLSSSHAREAALRVALEGVLAWDNAASEHDVDAMVEACRLALSSPLPVAKR